MVWGQGFRLDPAFRKLETSPDRRSLHDDGGRREVDRAGAVLRLEEELGLFQVAELQSQRHPLREVLGDRDVAALARGLTNAEVLVERLVVAGDGRRVRLGALPDVVRVAVDGDRSHVRPRRAVRRRAGRLRGAPVVDDVVLAQRIHRPDVDAAVDQAVDVRLRLREVGRDGAQLGGRLRLIEAQADARQEVVGLRPGGAERGAAAVHGHAPHARAVRPQLVRVAAVRAALAVRAVLLAAGQLRGGGAGDGRAARAGDAAAGRAAVRRRVAGRAAAPRGAAAGRAARSCHATAGVGAARAGGAGTARADAAAGPVAAA